MHIAWASPFNFQSAIGKFSKMVGEELQVRGHDVTVVRIEAGPELDLPAAESTLRVINAAECRADDFDVLVVNFGNHAPDHAQAIALAAQRSPLGIFHDMEMRDFEWGLADRHQMKLPLLHGVQEDLALEELSDMVHSDARPLLATLAGLTCGAVLHGPHYRETIDAFCPGGTKIIPLCFPGLGDGGRMLPTGPQMRVTIFGVINDNKQPSRVLEALALVPSKFKGAEVHLAGAIEDRVRNKLTRQALNLGLKVPVFHGYVPDLELRDIIDSSHAVCCLRYPVTEGGSASLVTALYRGRPLLISDIASYSSVPDELTFKVSYGDDPEDVAVALGTIFEHFDLAMTKALKAQEWAENRFSAPAYVDALEEMLHKAAQIRPVMRSLRNIVPSVSLHGHGPILPAVEAFAEAFDWIEAVQGD